MLGTIFGVVLLGELPDKTMFASLVLASKSRPWLVWLGAAAAFTVHVTIAVTVGGVLLTLLPHRVVQGIAAALFLVGAILAYREKGEEEEGAREASRFGGARTVGAAFVMIFIAEWGDLTQILVANMAAKYGQPLWVGLASLAALWTAAAIGAVGGGLIRRLPVTVLRRVTALILLCLSGLTAYSAITGNATVI